jgi:hypothetical protein
MIGYLQNQSFQKFSGIPAGLDECYGFQSLFQSDNIRSCSRLLTVCSVDASGGELNATSAAASSSFA